MIHFIQFFKTGSNCFIVIKFAKFFWGNFGGGKIQFHFLTIQISFDDGHDSGIFTWDYLFELGSNHTDNWADYLQRLHKANQSRDPDTQVVNLSWTPQQPLQWALNFER